MNASLIQICRPLLQGLFACCAIGKDASRQGSMVALTVNSSNTGREPVGIVDLSSHFSLPTMPAGNHQQLSATSSRENKDAVEPLNCEIRWCSLPSNTSRSKMTESKCCSASNASASGRQVAILQSQLNCDNSSASALSKSRSLFRGERDRMQ